MMKTIINKIVNINIVNGKNTPFAPFTVPFGDKPAGTKQALMQRSHDS